MADYYFRLNTPNHATHRTEHRHLASLSQAMIAARGLARRLIRSELRHGQAVHGSLDIEDEHHHPIARILLSDIARQIN
jgi:hypothetical protein